MNILYTASTARHIQDFHLPILARLCADGHSVTVACRDAGTLSGGFETLDIPYAKSFFSPRNVKAWTLLYTLLRRRFDRVLTHTALAGFLTRSALMMAGKRDTVCVHTAHGYLFGRQAPLTGRLTYLFERLCAPVTDAVFTMNAEDFGYAQKLVRRGGRVAAIPGMGVDLERFRPARPGEKAELRRALELPEGILLIYAAEFSKRKNHTHLLSAMRLTPPGITLLLAGDGTLREAMRRQASKQGIGDRVRFLGYVPDMAPLLRACDGAVSSSFSEGLPHNVLEALSSGLPVAASRVKGHVDLLNSSCLFNPRNPAEIAARLQAMVEELQTSCCEDKGHLIYEKEEAADAFIRLFWEIQ